MNIGRVFAVTKFLILSKDILKLSLFVLQKTFLIPLLGANYQPFIAE
jgi:hypothetical protein